MKAKRNKKTTGNCKKQGLASLEKGKKSEEVAEENAERTISHKDERFVWMKKAEFGCPICNYTVRTVGRVGRQGLHAAIQNSL